MQVVPEQAWVRLEQLLVQVLVLQQALVQQSLAQQWRGPIRHPMVPWPEPRPAQPRSPQSDRWFHPQEPCCQLASAQLPDTPH